MPTHYLNVPALYAALDEQRVTAGLSWRGVAQQTGLSPSSFTGLKAGDKPSADALCTLVAWLGLSLRQFIRPAA